MSWWDYGHLITTQAERIPHSNPFQQNARSSSTYLTAESEERAELVLDAIAAGEPVADRSTEELRQATSGSDSGEDVRYVMIDNEMAGQKFSPITQWSGPDYGHYVSGEQFSAGGTRRNNYRAQTRITTIRRSHRCTCRMRPGWNTTG